MSVTLNYTSKGLIDAIQKQLAQQKSEGKISGDISYSKIVTCDFWDAIKTINDSHDSKNKVYHGKGFSCNDSAQNTDWTKSVVVYGSTTLSDDEWETLLNAMGLKLTSKAAEAEEEPKIQEKEDTEQKEEVKAEETPSTAYYSMDLETAATLRTEVQKHCKTEYIDDVVNEFSSHQIVAADEYGTLVVYDIATDENGNKTKGAKLSSDQALERLKATAAKLNALK